MAGDDDFFSDDELDIPDTTLQELEQNAISSTQRPNPIHAQQAQKKHQSIAPLNRAGSLQQQPRQQQPWRPPQRVAAPFLQNQPGVPARQAPPPSAPDPPSSDYGFDDGDVIDLDESSVVLEPPSRLPTRSKAPLAPSAASAAIYGSKAPLDPETEAAFAQADAELGPANGVQWSRVPSVQPPTDGSIDVAALQARVKELEAQQARLHQLEQEARNVAAAKQGEIAIVRANQEKGAKEYERRLAVLQKMQADEAAKHKAELEAARQEREKMATNNRFLEHDLAQEAERVKRLNGPGRARIAPAASKGQETPRKAKRTNRADGFDDDEVLVISPSKVKEKPKDHTPKNGLKRKRTTQDSPIAPLSFKEPPRIDRLESNELPLPSAERSFSRAIGEDNGLEFMQRFLSHRPQEGHERSIEALAQCSFPSKPHESLSSMVMNELTLPPLASQSDDFPLRLARVSLRIWACCVREKHFAPFYLIMDMLRFAIHSQLSSMVSRLIEEALPMCIRTIELVATPLVAASSKSSTAAKELSQMQKSLNENIDVDDVMELLQRLCEAATLVDGRLEVFWQRMDLAFILLMLHKEQPINQIMVNLQILAISALPTSFSTITAITGDPETQAKTESVTIDRLSSLLSEIPEAPADEPPYTEEEIAELRLEIMNVFQALCYTQHGGLILAQHPYAVGRLMRFLDGQVNKLYTLPPGTGTAIGPDTPPSAHDLVIKTINQTTRLLYHLLRTFDDSVDFAQKIRDVSGAHDKFLISMTRIAFSEQLVFEHGIEDDVTEAAHSILDNLLTPEEGEAVVMAVETPRGSKGTSIGFGGGVGGEEERGSDGEGDISMSEPG